MKKLTKRLLAIISILMPAMAMAQTTCYTDKPFGFATCTSRTDASTTYHVTGGGISSITEAMSMLKSNTPRAVRLYSTGEAMDDAILKAITDNDVIVFDGAKGDFIIASSIIVERLKNKTILGINNARLCTAWYASQEIIKALNDAGVPNMSTSRGTGGKLSNGAMVGEEAEFRTRQIIIDMTGDQEELYRNSGVLTFRACENFIIRNLKFVGPGSIDVGGADLMSIIRSTHIWVDHCDFTDGMDGNFDITQSADFNTVSWCTFSYTERAYMHQNTNLVGYSDKEIPGFLNTTFAFNKWGKGCRARMPMVRAGKIHMLNNYYDCAGNLTSCINPRLYSEFLIEGNYFDSKVSNVFSQSGAVAWTWKESNIIACGKEAPESKGNVTVPYEYSVMDANKVAEVVGKNAGATLKDCTAATIPAQAGTPLTFESNALYSKLVIESRLHDFYANKKLRGINTFDFNGNSVAPAAGGMEFDYVPGLVAKAVIEAAQYYSSEAWAKPWFYSVQSYANTNAAKVPTVGGSLDDLNAAKMYFGVYELASGDYKDIADPNTVSNAKLAFELTAKGLAAHNEKYTIKTGDKASYGGWFHKSSYVNQMWLDGQYMGPALLAQLLNKGYGINKKASDDWNLITKQFTICWKHLWDDKKELLYHAFSSTPDDQYANTWADSKTYHSQEYWGRAVGWYFLALVDVLEEMQKANLSKTANYKTLRAYLNKIATGLEKRADEKTGCWYQLLQYDDTFAASRYNNKDFSSISNYLESSASAIFIATYLKGARLGLFDKDYTALAKKAYKGFVETFIVSDGEGGIHIINSCRSAGLGGSSYRDGSAAYYLLGNDVSMVKAADKQTEGKVLGAFILAATEYERCIAGK